MAVTQRRAGEGEGRRRRPIKSKRELLKADMGILIFQWLDGAAQVLLSFSTRNSPTRTLRPISQVISHLLNVFHVFDPPVHLLFLSSVFFGVMSQAQ